MTQLPHFLCSQESYFSISFSVIRRVTIGLVEIYKILTLLYFSKEKSHHQAKEIETS